MFFEIILATLLGTFAGTFTGLAPGIHVNLVAVLLLTLSPALLQFTTPIALVAFIIAMAVTHTFLDFLPSIYLGAPDADTALAVLPGHKLLLHGRGFEAVKLSVIGSLLSLILACALIPFLLPLVASMQSYLKPHLGILIALIIGFMIFKDDRWQWNLAVFLLSGSLGLIVLNLPMLDDPLFPMLSGLFGISTLLLSLNEQIRLPYQMETESLEIQRQKVLTATIGGTAVGFLTAFFPGLGPAQGAVLASQFLRRLGDYGFLMLVGGIGTVNFVLSLVTWAQLDKARNGAVAAAMELLSPLTPQVLALLVAVALIAGSIAAWLALKLARLFAKWIVKIPYPKLILIVMALVVLLVTVLTGPIGLTVLIVSTCIGLIPAVKHVPRNHAMGCLLLPVVLYFLL